MTRKFTQEEVAQYFKEHGYTLLSEYINRSTKVTIRNQKGEEYEVTFANFKYGYRPENRRNTKYTQEEVASYFKEHGYELLSEYKGIKEKVVVRNSKGEEYTTLFETFKRGQRPENRNAKLSQEEVAQYFKEHGYTLLSEYKGSNSNLLIRNKNGEKFKTKLGNFKQGQRPENRNDKLSQEEVAQYFKEHGYELLSEYKNSNTKVRIKNSDGEEYQVFLSNFKRGMRPERKPGYAEEIVRDILSSQGYTLISHYTGVKEDITLLCERGHELVTTFDAFNHGRRCEACAGSIVESGMSMGEHLVWSVLINNPLYVRNLKKEVRVDIGGELHRFDFMFEVNDNYYAIEYDGQQHYVDKHFFGNLAHRKHRDTQKDKYAFDKGITMVRIPYTIDTLPTIAQYLSSRVGVDLNAPTQLWVTNIADVVDYYLSNSLEGTAEKFKLSRRAVTTYFKATKGMSRTKYLINVASEYYLEHTLEETKQKFGLSLPTISRGFEKKYGMRKGAYKEQQRRLPYTDEQLEVSRHLLTHTISETVEVYGYSRSTLSNWFKKVWGVTKTEYLKHNNI